MSAELSPIDLATERSFPLGPHVVHPSTREITTTQERVTLEPRVMQVLVALAQQPGATVSRDHLIARCWDGVVVGEDSIQRCIGRLRKTAEAIGGFEIETLSRVGYRLHASSTRADDADPMPMPNAPLLAVLPFDNLSEDPGLSYLADGVAEDILRTIARTSTVTAIGRTSSFQFRGAAKVVATIGEALGATHILDGSVRRAGARVRVSAHLTDVADHTMLWSDRFEGLVEDLFALEDQVAAAVVGVLRGTFRSTEPARPLDLEASEVAMRVRDLIATPTGLRDQGSQTLAARLEVCLTPQSAEAWGMIATAQATLRWVADDGDAVRLRQQAEISIGRALAIDPLCGEAHKARYLLVPPAGHFTDAERPLLDVSKRAPSCDVHWALFVLRLAVGRVSDAVAHAEAAYRMDPLRPPNITAFGFALLARGDTAPALRVLEEVVERWPDDPGALAMAVWLTSSAGDMARVDRLFEYYRPERYPPAALPALDATFFAARAWRNPSPDALEQARCRVQEDVTAARLRFSLVALWANLGGDLDTIFDTISAAALAPLRAETGRLSLLDGLGHLFAPMNARLRQSPRFVELCRTLGLVEYWEASGHWPDCVTELASSYDFISEAKRTLR